MQTTEFRNTAQSNTGFEDSTYACPDDDRGLDYSVAEPLDYSYPALECPEARQPYTGINESNADEQFRENGPDADSRYTASISGNGPPLPDRNISFIKKARSDSHNLRKDIVMKKFDVYEQPLPLSHQVW